MNVFLLSGAFPLRVSGVNYSSGRWMRSLKWLQPPGSKPKAKMHEKNTGLTKYSLPDPSNTRLKEQGCCFREKWHHRQQMQQAGDGSSAQ